MSAKFLKVMALSKRPSDFKGTVADKEPEPLKDTGFVQGPGSTEATVVSEGAAPSKHGEASPAEAASRKREEQSTAIERSVSHEASVPSKDTGAYKGTGLQQQPTLRIYHCVRAQDGHSFAEDRLYGALWNSDLARAETPETRLITIGWDRMAQLAGMTPRNARENCFRLIQKLAFERTQKHVSEERIGTTYRIFSLDAIVKRRAAAGLEWVVRNRGGVTFVAAPSKDTETHKSTRDTDASDVARSCRREAAGIIEAWIRDARAILRRPDAAEADRAWAREILARGGG